MIEVPVDIWSAAVKETSRIVRGFQIPIRRTTFRPIYFGILIANLSVALDRESEDFGGHVPADHQLPNLFRIRNVTIVPANQGTI